MESCVRPSSPEPRRSASPANEHGWRIGRILDPFGHEWEVAKPLGTWPPER